MKQQLKQAALDPVLTALVRRENTSALLFFSRDLLILAVSRPGQKALSRMWKVRNGPSTKLRCGPEWSYPCAIESDGNLWVVYTSEKHPCVLTRSPLDSLAAQ